MLNRRKYALSLICSCILFLQNALLVIGDPYPPLTPITPQNVYEIQELNTIGRGWIADSDLSPDGKTLAVAGTLGVWLHDANNLRKSPHHLVDTPNIGYVKFSPDGKWLAFGSTEVGIHLWNTQSTDQHISFSAKPRMVAFSPDSNVLAYEKQSGEIALRDINAGRVNTVLRFDTFEMGDVVEGLAFSPDGKLLALATSYRILIWSLDSPDEPRMIAPDIGGIWSGNILAFSPDSTLIAAGQGESAAVWNIDTLSKVATFSANRYPISNVTFSADGKRLITAVGFYLGGRFHDSVQIWDLTSGDQIATVASSTSGLVEAAIAPDGQSLFISNLDTVQRWDIAENRLRDATTGYLGYVNSLTFSADNSLIAAGFSNGEVRLLDTVSGEERLMVETWAEVDKVILSADSKVLVALSTLHGLPSPSKVWVWDVASGAELLLLEDDLTLGAGDVALSPDGSLLASSFCSDINRTEICLGQIQLWDTSTGALVAVFDVESGFVTSLVFSQDGKYLASKSA
ncbi:MAG: WD40 repeat domain-containing protein, partial [Anaerolineae bacterium]|nr:WD40 repeat domain-containing protein [Anaerolineae bacterium]